MVEIIKPGTIQLFVEGVEIKNIEGINEDPQWEHVTNSNVGVKGTDTQYISEEGRKITFHSSIPYDEPKYDIRFYRKLAEKLKIPPKTEPFAYLLTSNAKGDYKGNYILVDFQPKMDNAGNYELDWHFQEVIVPKVTEKTFRVFGTATTTKKTGTVKKAVASNNTMLLILNCPVMGRKIKIGNGKTTYEEKKGISCVKRLQKFLQAGGYYTKYLVDGWFSTYTAKELKKAQKKRKLKQTGNWDKKTIEYYKKLYKLTNPKATFNISQPQQSSVVKQILKK